MAAWAADEKLDQEIELPFGKFPGSVVVQIYAEEHITHGWDLAVATQQRDDLDESLAEVALPIMLQMVPADIRGGEMPFEAVVEVPEDRLPTTASPATWGASRSQSQAGSRSAGVPRRSSGP